MTDKKTEGMEVCCGEESAGRDTCELPSVGFDRAPRRSAYCPQCAGVGKPVSIRTVRSMLAVSLRALTARDYFFCRTRTCPVVYFAAGHDEEYGAEDIRERVYQKEPDAEESIVCYCFRHRVGDFHRASNRARHDLVQDVRDGIQQGQCACDLRNPQWSCCLGNVIALVHRIEDGRSHAGGSSASISFREA